MEQDIVKLWKSGVPVDEWLKHIRYDWCDDKDDSVPFSWKLGVKIGIINISFMLLQYEHVY